MAPELRVLVGYASAAGSTRQIAERIAAGIRAGAAADGSSAEVTCVAAAPEVDPAGYDALVVGSAVHDMAWLPPAVGLLRRCARTGAPVWVFSVGSLEPRGPLTRALVRPERSRVAREFPPGFVPRDHRVFAGVVVMTGVPLWGRLFWWACGGRPGDHRDWAAIETWARGIAAAAATSGRRPAGRRP